MSGFKLGRLVINEHHSDDFPAELLSLTVGEVLDRLGAVDTEDNAEYEVIEAALKAVASTVLAEAQPSNSMSTPPPPPPLPPPPLPTNKPFQTSGEHSNKKGPWPTKQRDDLDFIF